MIKTTTQYFRFNVCHSISENRNNPLLKKELIGTKGHTEEEVFAGAERSGFYLCAETDAAGKSFVKISFPSYINDEYLSWIVTGCDVTPRKANIYFLGLNVMYHAIETEDTAVFHVLDEVLGN